MSMTERVRTTAVNGLRLRDSPRDGITLDVLQSGSELEVLGRETWLRVRHGGKTGFVLADFVEPTVGIAPRAPTATNDASEFRTPTYTGRVNIIEYHSTLDVFRGATIRADEEFVPCLDFLGKLAQRNQIRIFITSSLREPNKPVANAIVSPAQFSNHHVGHGIDMNILLDDRLISSGELANIEALPTGPQTFLRTLQKMNGQFRWGGDFSKVDPVHIDNGLNVFHGAAYAEKLQALWGMKPQNETTSRILSPDELRAKVRSGELNVPRL
jgi:hypothetical protein